jgi:hypothetical protein
LRKKENYQGAVGACPFHEMKAVVSADPVLSLDFEQRMIR